MNLMNTLEQKKCDNSDTQCKIKQQNSEPEQLIPNYHDEPEYNIMENWRGLGEPKN